MIKIITDLLNIASFKPFLSARGRSIRGYVGPSVGWSVGQLVSCLVHRSVGLSVCAKLFSAFDLASYRFALGRILAIHLFLFALLILQRSRLHDIILRHLNPY